MESLKDIMARFKIEPAISSEIEHSDDEGFDRAFYWATHPAAYIYHKVFGEQFRLYADCSLNDFGNQGEQVEKWLEMGKGLYIWGGVGVGKTHMALSCLKWQLERGKRGNILIVAEMLDRFRYFIGLKEGDVVDRLISDFAKNEFLVLDDLGVQVGTPWADEKLYEIINQRWLNRDNLITVVTSNYPPGELENRAKDGIIGERMVSRLIGMTEQIEIKGRDRRLPKRSREE